jgi:uncharacterized tellurite resistance protein B-like protein
MLGKIKDLFTKKISLYECNGQRISKEMLTAISVILLEMSGRDDDYAPEEVLTIISSLRDYFLVEESEAKQLIEKADKLRKTEEKLDGFVKTINDNYTVKQRQLLLSLLWKIVITDGVIDKFEKRFAEEMRNRLLLSEAQADQARATAEYGEI